MTSDRPPLTQDRLKELLHYDPETGHFTWRVTRGGVAVGSRAGSTGSHGYTQIRIDDLPRLAHRLAFLYMTGETPLEVDHVDRVKSNNSWPNLRPATSRENKGNVGLQRNNTSGFRGVSRHKLTGKWQAEGTRARRRIYLGLYDTRENAAAVAQKWREEYFKEFACIPNPGPLPRSPNPES